MTGRCREKTRNYELRRHVLVRNFKALELRICQLRKKNETRSAVRFCFAFHSAHERSAHATPAELAMSSLVTASREDPLLPEKLPYTTRDLDVEDAEGAVLSSIESRSSHGQHDANDDEQRMYHAMNPRKSFKSAVRRVQQMNSVVRQLKRKTEMDGLMSKPSFDSRTLDPNEHDHLFHHSNPLQPHEGDPFLDDRFPDMSLHSSGSQDTSLRKKHRRKRMLACCHPLTMLRVLCYALRVSSAALIAIPLSAIAYVLYYYADDPDLDFLPGSATLSFWLNFAARLCVTFGLACCSQYIFIDCFILTTGLAGPLPTLTFLQAKGWPFLLVMWSWLNLILLQGDDQFQRHWLYWTGLEIYNTETGYYVLDSGIYLRFLLSGLIAGSLAAAKRTFVALHFGGQQLLAYQPRLEKLLADTVILSEVGALALQAEKNVQQPNGKSSVTTVDIGPPNVDFLAASAAVFSDEDSSSKDSSGTRNKSFSAAPSETEKSIHHIKSLLMVWKVPVDKRDKSKGPTIRDILRFRRALSYLDDTHPFGEDFGPAATRDECTSSSHRNFWRLMKLTPLTESLPFDVLQFLAIGEDEDGTEDKAKAMLIRKLFRPNCYGNITLLAFVQSCDNVYKRFRYFRASLDNANVINDVMERMLNAVFFFVLTLLLLSVMRIDAWALLFSMTSLLVSVSFALGPSVSKYVEGVLLIVRRPYDLGDRIFFSSAEAINPEPNITSFSWFVEDISLTTTTLRYARTNEVSTVNNWSIAGSRIVNCNRSPIATVHLTMDMHMSIFENDNLKKFRDALNKYVADRPRSWDSVSFCRHDDFDVDSEKVKFTISVRHRHSWQDAARIKVNRADLVRFLYETSKELSIQYEEPPPQQVLYYGGSLKENDGKDGYKRSLLSSDNIKAQFTLGSSDPLTPTVLRYKPTTVTAETSSAGLSSRSCEIGERAAD